jgi:hypothetical protein
MTSRKLISILGLFSLLGLAVVLAGCSEDNPIATTNPTDDSEFSDEGKLDYEREITQAADKGVQIIQQDGSAIPGEIAEVTLGSQTISFWPYTGTTLEESPVDPINLVFTGLANPVQIRQALMSLDGDRSAFGLPDMEPFNLPWIDAVGGDVQTTYLTEGGWEGSVVQLTLGVYSGLRVHLRLFGTDLDDGQGGTWTLGGAHFEMMIPGTSEHAVLSWELAQDIVMADMMRCGLLLTEPAPTGLINAAPEYRSIPPYIVGPLMEDPAGQMLLIGLLGYEFGDIVPGQDLPIPSDGQGTLFQLGSALPFDHHGDLNSTENTVVIEYSQYIPSPVCNSGYDMLLVTGPVTFTAQVNVTANGRYHYLNSYDGVLQAVPVDGNYQPIGPAFEAMVSGRQNGQTGPNLRKVGSGDKRLALRADGPEMLTEVLRVGTVGNLSYRSFERCFDGD